MKAYHLIIAGAFGLVLVICQGCRSIYRVEPVIDPTTPRKAIWSGKSLFSRSGFRQWILDMKPLYINPYTFVAPGDTTPLYEIASYKGEDEQKRHQAKLARNQLQNTILELSNECTGQHLAGIKSAENGGNLLLGGAALGLSGGASVAAPTTARALSAAATGTGGSRALFNEQTFRNALVESLTQAVETDRAQFLETIIRPKQNWDVEQYDVEAAILEARDYHERGSFYHGLELIREAVEEKNASRKTNTLSVVKERLSENPQSR